MTVARMRRITSLRAGLPSLAERWTLRHGASGDEEVVCIQEANASAVTVARGYYSLPGVPTLTITAAQIRSGEWQMHPDATTSMRCRSGEHPFDRATIGRCSLPATSSPSADRSRWPHSRARPRRSCIEECERLTLERKEIAAVLAELPGAVNELRTALNRLHAIVG